MFCVLSWWDAAWQTHGHLIPLELINRAVIINNPSPQPVRLVLHRQRTKKHAPVLWPEIWHFLIQFPFNQIPSRGGTGSRLAVPSAVWAPHPTPTQDRQYSFTQTDETLVVTGFCSSVMLASDCLWCADPWHYMKSLVQALYWLPVQCCIKWETIALQLGLHSAQCKGSL